MVIFSQSCRAWVVIQAMFILSAFAQYVHHQRIIWLNKRIIIWIRETFIRLLSLAVTNVYFIANGPWYKQCDCVAMGSVLAVILANCGSVNMKGSSRRQTPLCRLAVHVQTRTNIKLAELCMRYQTKVTKRGYSIRCNECHTWCRRKCTDLKVDDIRRYSRNNTPWYCGCHSNIAQVQVSSLKAKVFGRYVDDIIRTDKVADIDNIMSHANNLHPASSSLQKEKWILKYRFLTWWWNVMMGNSALPGIANPQTQASCCHSDHVPNSTSEIS